MNADEMEGQSKLTQKMIKILKPNRPYENQYDMKLWRLQIWQFHAFLNVPILSVPMLRIKIKMIESF